MINLRDPDAQQRYLNIKEKKDNEYKEREFMLPRSKSNNSKYNGTYDQDIIRFNNGSFHKSGGERL